MIFYEINQFITTLRNNNEINDRKTLLASPELPL